MYGYLLLLMYVSDHDLQTIKYGHCESTIWPVSFHTNQNHIAGYIGIKLFSIHYTAIADCTIESAQLGYKNS